MDEERRTNVEVSGYLKMYKVIKLFIPTFENDTSDIKSILYILITLLIKFVSILGQPIIIDEMERLPFAWIVLQISCKARQRIGRWLFEPRS